jgi:very-short-patch-repair endonuclease
MSGDPVPIRARLERVLTATAARQHGVVTRRQLLEAGVSPSMIQRARTTDRVHTVHAGVYRVAGATDPWAREMAAVLACGAQAVAGFWSAAALWQLLPASRSRDVHVIAPGGHRVRPTIRTHRIRLLPDETTTMDAVPVTTPERTLVDLAGAAPARETERALAQGLDLDLVRRELLRAAAERHAGRPGVRLLAACLRDGVDLTRSEAEERFRSLVLRGGLPAPKCNARVGAFEVDFLWRDERVVVEIDGLACHGSKAAHQRDRRRDAALQAAGYVVMRFTWRRLVEEELRVLVEVARALALRTAG